MFFYQVKHDMIVSPMKNFVACTLAGFLFNAPLMGAIIVVYEKYTVNKLDYSRSMIPIIVLASAVILLLMTTIFTLGIDLLDKGCLAWHRDSIGHLVQAVLAYICVLCTSINLKEYIELIEDNNGVYPIEESVLDCFTPLLILAGLWLLKILCFRVRNSIMHLAIAISVASLAFAFESHFDNQESNAPLFIVAIPVSCILLAISFQ